MQNHFPFSPCIWKKAVAFSLLAPTVESRQKRDDMPLYHCRLKKAAAENVDNVREALEKKDAHWHTLIAGKEANHDVHGTLEKRDVYWRSIIVGLETKFDDERRESADGDIVKLVQRLSQV